MNIVHLCLSGPFTENLTYQENLLAKYHRKSGNEVTIIASCWKWGEEGTLIKDNRKYYLMNDGTKIIRLKMKGINNFNKKIKRYKNLYEAMEKSEPNIIFIHGCQFIDIRYVKKYVKLNPQTKVYVDNHADFSNSATNWVSKEILHKIIWKKCAHLINPYTSKFYGVLPARVDFLTNIYGLPEKKVDLLVMGADDDRVKSNSNSLSRDKFREKHSIKVNDFLIVTGGKIDKSKKQVLLLMEAISSIKTEDVKLIIFGSVIPELKDEIQKLTDGIKIQYVGWIKPEESYEYFAASDLVVFPGRHSVFWEQALGQGKPMIVKYWPGTTHIDLGGNVNFLYNDSVEEIRNNVLEIYSDALKYEEMERIARDEGMKKFSYSSIARKSIMSN